MNFWICLARLARDRRDAQAAERLGKELGRAADETRLREDTRRDDAIAEVRLKFLDRAQFILSSVAGKADELKAASADDPEAVLAGRIPRELLELANRQLERYAGASLHNARKSIDRKARAEQRKSKRLAEEHAQVAEGARRSAEIEEAFESIRTLVKLELHRFRDMQIDVPATLEELFDLACQRRTMRDLVLSHFVGSDPPKEAERVRIRDALYQRHGRLRKVLLQVLEYKEGRGQMNEMDAQAFRSVVTAVLRRRRAS